MPVAVDAKCSTCTGAGDTVLAVLALAAAAKAPIRDATLLANIAAGEVVGKLGTASADAR